MHPAFSYALKSVGVLVLVVVPGVFFVAFVGGVGSVQGISMFPTFQNGEPVFIDKVTLLFRSPRRGDIVSAYDGVNASYSVMKRVAGLPGERVIVQEGKVFVAVPGGKMAPLKEGYLSDKIVTEPPFTNAYAYRILMPNEYFIMGDNRPFSSDSRVYGPVPRYRIVGLVRKLPFSK